MTRLERRMKEAKRDTIFASEIIRAYNSEINELRGKLRLTKNGFRRTCIMQEIETLTTEKKIIDAECIG